MMDKQHLDTQVVSYAISGSWEEPLDGCVISSIVANELFLVQGNDPANANLYVPLLSANHTMGPLASELRRRDHPFNRSLSDSIVMDFGNEFPTIIEYNSLSISIAINDGLTDLMVGVVNHLDKHIKKKLMQRFRFLVDNGIRCNPLRTPDVETAFELLAKFKVNYNVKGNFRNTWNDLLILSSAMTAGENLVTEDNLLSRFAAEQSGVAPTKKQGFLELPFAVTNSEERKSSRESKGYINTGWRVEFSKPPIPSQTK